LQVSIYNCVREQTLSILLFQDNIARNTSSDIYIYYRSAETISEVIFESVYQQSTEQCSAINNQNNYFYIVTIFFV